MGMWRYCYKDACENNADWPRTTHQARSFCGRGAQRTFRGIRAITVKIAAQRRRLPVCLFCLFCRRFLRNRVFTRCAPRPIQFAFISPCNPTLRSTSHDTTHHTPRGRTPAYRPRPLHRRHQPARTVARRGAARRPPARGHCRHQHRGRACHARRALRPHCGRSRGGRLAVHARRCALRGHRWHENQQALLAGPRQGTRALCRPAGRPSRR